VQHSIEPSSVIETSSHFNTGYDSYASSKLAAAKFFEFVQAENLSILYSIGLKVGLIPKQFLVSRIDNYADVNYDMIKSKVHMNNPAS
jgi:hypothetical protein